MKRDWELIKEILFQVESNPNPRDWIEITSAKFNADSISYHISILHGAGLVEAYNASSFDEFKWLPVSLTWEGHNFLDNARNETVWKKTVQLVKDKGGSVSFNVFQNLLQNQATKLFEGFL